MKGIHPIIGAVLVIIISVSIIAIVLELGKPATQRIREILLFNEGKNNLKLIKNYVDSVIEEGEGSSRIPSLSVTDGSYVIDPNKDIVTFSMETKEQIFGVGVSKIEDGINITGSVNKITMVLNLSNVDVTEGGTFGKGKHKILIKNNGYNSTSQEQIVLIKPL
jgi:hypothetical protein